MKVHVSCEEEIIDLSQSCKHKSVFFSEEATENNEESKIKYTFKRRFKLQREQKQQKQRDREKRIRQRKIKKTNKKKNRHGKKQMLL